MIQWGLGFLTNELSMPVQWMKPIWKSIKAKQQSRKQGNKCQKQAIRMDNLSIYETWFEFHAVLVLDWLAWLCLALVWLKFDAYAKWIIMQTNFYLQSDNVQFNICNHRTQEHNASQSASNQSHFRSLRLHFFPCAQTLSIIEKKTTTIPQYHR